MTRLRSKLIDDLTVRGRAPATRRAYLHAVEGLAKHYRRSPDRISDEEVQAYLAHLVRDRHLCFSSMNVAVQGLRFLYYITLGRDRMQFSIPMARVPSMLPEILSREEVQLLLSMTQNLKHRAMLTLAYAAGLRASPPGRMGGRFLGCAAGLPPRSDNERSVTWIGDPTALADSLRQDDAGSQRV